MYMAGGVQNEAPGQGPVLDPHQMAAMGSCSEPGSLSPLSSGCGLASLGTLDKISKEAQVL